MHCRHCGNSVAHVFVDLGQQPSANRLVSNEELAAIQGGKTEPTFPLKVMVCDQCYLVQLNDYRRPEDMFTAEYAYFSSYSGSWVEHAKRYVEQVTPRFGLDTNSFVVEIASNDGYLLRNFVANGVPCLGVDPAENAAQAARDHGVETLVDFFGLALATSIATDRGRADLVLGNNVFAHVPDVNDFVQGVCALLKDDGVVTLEFPHVARLVEYVQFDTIYDEHYSYLSLGTVRTIFEKAGLSIFDVEELPTHGGSLRVYGQRTDTGARAVEASVGAVLKAEADMGLNSLARYQGFQAEVDTIRDDFLALMKAEKEAGNRIAAFGAAAKGNVFLNYTHVGADTIEYVVDDTPIKQGRNLPGSHIPVVPEEVLKENKPDVVVILAWNFAPEIKKRLAYIGEWGGRFVTAVPKVEVTSP